MPNPPLNEDLDLAHQLADAADAITLDRFQALDLVIETKADMTPVSDADTAVERAIRDLLALRRPDDVVLGEEFGAESTSHDRRWIIDPIDGTKSFISGNGNQFDCHLRNLSSCSCYDLRIRHALLHLNPSRVNNSLITFRLLLCN